jgi:hypothetical protein
MTAISPPSTAPPIRRTPCSTTTASQTNPAWAGRSVAVIEPLEIAYSTPPSPAIAEASTKSRILVRGADSPEVTAAAGADRTARIARPDADFSRFFTRSPTTPISPSSTTTRTRGSDVSANPNPSAGSDHPIVPLLNASTWNSTWSARSASASVASVSTRPPSRSAGSATSSPTAPAASTPSPIAARNGSPEANAHPQVSAAIAAKDACARFTMPPIPVTTTNEQKISASTSPWAATPT